VLPAQGQQDAALRDGGDFGVTVDLLGDAGGEVVAGAHADEPEAADWDLSACVPLEQELVLGSAEQSLAAVGEG
jgi:hypothetical protein